jgi:zona occludens toxin (predicted ATPase)
MSMRGLVLWTVALLSVSSAALAAEPASAAKPSAAGDDKSPNSASSSASGPQATLTSAVASGAVAGAAKPNCLTLVSSPERFRACMREARTVLRHPTPRPTERRTWLNPSGWLPGS